MVRTNNEMRNGMNLPANADGGQLPSFSPNDNVPQPASVPSHNADWNAQISSYLVAMQEHAWHTAAFNYNLMQCTDWKFYNQSVLNGNYINAVSTQQSAYNNAQLYSNFGTNSGQFAFAETHNDYTYAFSQNQMQQFEQSMFSQYNYLRHFFQSQQICQTQSVCRQQEFSQCTLWSQNHTNDSPGFNSVSGLDHPFNDGGVCPRTGRKRPFNSTGSPNNSNFAFLNTDTCQRFLTSTSSQDGHFNGICQSAYLPLAASVPTPNNEKRNGAKRRRNQQHPQAAVMDAANHFHGNDNGEGGSVPNSAPGPK